MKMITVAFLLLFCITELFSNNLRISNVSIAGQNTVSDYAIVELDINWENSWRTDNLNGEGVENWDAVWLFVKYRKHSDGKWYHAALNSIAGNHSCGTGTGASFFPASDGTGIFVYREENGSGTFTQSNIQIRWDYGSQTGGGALGDALNCDIQVFGIEMVYVPEGSFYAGDFNSTGTFRQSSNSTPVQITESPVVVKCSNTSYDDDKLEDTGILVDGDNGIDKDGSSAVDNTGFPTGYKAFYSMKYEITQEQYADFLNTLTSSQKSARFPNQFNNFRHFLREVSGVYGCDANNNGVLNESDDGQNTACNYLSWADGAAYADWAGLRPMTELEFEKACRGIKNPVSGEYAWGTTQIAGSAYTLSGSGTENEDISTGYSTNAGNCSYSITDGSINGPLRVGIFAGNSANTDRITSGASYYGIMELSGNLWERPVILGEQTGRNFTGEHGNGILDASGNADVSNWPGTNAEGAGFRGGRWNINQSYCRISGREEASYTSNSRSQFNGFRCVRSAGE